MFSKILNLILACILLLGAESLFAAQDFIVAQAYFEDKSNQLTLDDIKRQSFTPYEHLLTKGYSRSTYWLKLRVKASTDGSVDPLVLRIRPAFHDQLELFDPLDPRSQARLTGDRFPWANDEYRSFNLNFLLKSADQDRDVYLKLKSAHSYTLGVEALRHRDAEKADLFQAMYNLTYLSLILILFIWGLVTFSFQQERVLGAYCLVLFVSAMYSASMMGIARILLDGLVSNNILDHLTNFAILANFFFPMVFHKEFLAEYNPKPVYRWALYGPVFIFAFNLFLLFIDEATLALKLNMIAVLIYSSLLFLVSWFGINWKEIHSATLLKNNFVRLFYGVYTLSCLVAAVPYLGIMQATDLTLHTIYWNGISICFVMFMMMQYRIKNMNQIQLKKIAVQTQKAEQEKLTRLEQAKFMAMLNHEIKTPLSVIQLAIDRGITNPSLETQANEAIAEVNQIIDRCLQMDKLEQGAQLVRKVEISAVSLIKDLLTRIDDAPRFELSCQTDRPVRSDPFLFQMVISNLLDNALKYSPPKTRIDIVIEELQEHDLDALKISVANQVSKAGLPDATKVFEKYYRSPTAHAKIGSGLGLYLVKALCDMLGGSVRYVPGAGFVKFEVVLPR
ncbi:MAG: 7TM-DISM domain-containing protein [Limnohabitans sp.]